LLLLLLLVLLLLPPAQLNWTLSTVRCPGICVRQALYNLAEKQLMDAMFTQQQCDWDLPKGE